MKKMMGNYRKTTTTALFADMCADGNGRQYP